jgi:hypothetical protein
MKMEEMWHSRLPLKFFLKKIVWMVDRNRIQTWTT